MPDPLTERLEACYSGAVYDVLRTMGQANQVLPPSIRPIDTAFKVAGRVYTVSGHVDKTRDPHDTLLSWTGLLSKSPADSVVICQPNDSTMAHMGELSAEALQVRGVRGYIVDGGCRDTDAVLKAGLRVFCRYFTPVDVVGRWIADRLGEPITIGEVTISSGDYVLADRDGIVIVPGAIIDDVVDKTEEVLRTENLVRKAIVEGADPQEAYLKYRKF